MVFDCSRGQGAVGKPFGERLAKSSVAQGIIEQPFWKRLAKNSIAQGTIEYLVIIAVIVVISLVVVGLSTNMVGSPGQEISSSANKIGSLTSGGITVVDAITDPNGNSLVSLNNNTGDNLTLTKVVVGNNETSFNEQLVTASSKAFSLSDLNLACPCVSGQSTVSCNFTFYITTSSGLQKTYTTTVTTQCMQTVQSTNPGQVVGLGVGTFSEPWIINSCRELQNMSQHLDGNYALGADINCGETRGWNSDAGFSPVGNTTVSFSGSFNGRNHTISGVYINRSQNVVGLFGKLTGTISNIGLIDANVKGSNYTGGLVGLTYGSISNSYSNGNVRGTSSVGGLVGEQESGSISSSYSSGSVIGTSANIGGLAGYQFAGVISSCYSSANVTGNTSSVGGLVGYALLTSISDSYSTGNVTGSTFGAGGLVGGSWASISNCYSTGRVSGSTRVGGLVGELQAGSIFNSFATGTVIGTSDMNGIVGYESGNAVSNLYWLDSNLSDNAIGCWGYSNSDSDCTKATVASDFYSSAYGVYTVSPVWNDGNWVWPGNAYPRLSWQ